MVMSVIFGGLQDVYLVASVVFVMLLKIKELICCLLLIKLVKIVMGKNLKDLITDKTCLCPYNNLYNILIHKQKSLKSIMLPKLMP